jgi:hypothetical protein
MIEFLDGSLERGRGGWGEGGRIKRVHVHIEIGNRPTIRIGQNDTGKRHQNKIKQTRFHLITYGRAANDSSSAALRCLLYTNGEGINFLSFSSFHMRGKVKRGNLFTVALLWAGINNSFVFLNWRLGFLSRLNVHVSLKENGNWWCM